MLEDFEVDLPGPGQFRIVHLLRQVGERGPVARRPAGAGLWRDVIQEMVVAVVAQLRRRQRPRAELLVEVRLEKLGQAVLLGGAGHGRGHDKEP